MTRRYTQDGYHYTIRSVEIPEDDFRSLKCCSVISTVYGQGLRRIGRFPVHFPG